MNDTELIAAVHEQRHAVPMTVPLDQITRRGRALRARHRIRGAAALVTAAATAVLAVLALVPASRQANPVHASLAAWTVTKEPGGNVRVTIRKLSHPAGLQAALRADGIPAHVYSDRYATDPCQLYGRANTPASIKSYLALLGRIASYYPAADHSRFGSLVIHPAAIPRGAGIEIIDGQTMHTRYDGRRVTYMTGWRTVRAAPGCTSR